MLLLPIRRKPIDGLQVAHPRPWGAGHATFRPRSVPAWTPFTKPFCSRKKDRPAHRFGVVIPTLAAAGRWPHELSCPDQPSRSEVADSDKWPEAKPPTDFPRQIRPPGPTKVTVRDGTTERSLKKFTKRIKENLSQWQKVNKQVANEETFAWVY